MMNDRYGMRRANGDWFAVKKHDGLRVPIFSSNEEAIQARMFNVEMLVFRPALLDERALDDLAPTVNDAPAYFWLVEPGCRTLMRGHALTHAELSDFCAGYNEAE
jgi:hypothetical protein